MITHEILIYITAKGVWKMANLFKSTTNRLHPTIDVRRSGIGDVDNSLGNVTSKGGVLNAKGGVLKEKFLPCAKLVLFWFVVIQLYTLVPLREKIYAISMIKIVGYYKDRGKPWKWRIFHKDHPFNAEVSQ